MTIKTQSRDSFLFGAEQIFDEESIGFANGNRLVYIPPWDLGADQRGRKEIAIPKFLLVEDQCMSNSF